MNHKLRLVSKRKKKPEYNNNNNKTPSHSKIPSLNLLVSSLFFPSIPEFVHLIPVPPPSPGVFLLSLHWQYVIFGNIFLDL